jgi:hypothetical protein
MCQFRLRSPSGTRGTELRRWPTGAPAPAARISAKERSPSHPTAVSAGRRDGAVLRSGRSLSFAARVTPGLRSSRTRAVARACLRRALPVCCIARTAAARGSREDNTSSSRPSERGTSGSPSALAPATSKSARSCVQRTAAGAGNVSGDHVSAQPAPPSLSFPLATAGFCARVSRGLVCSRRRSSRPETEGSAGASSPTRLSLGLAETVGGSARGAIPTVLASSRPDTGCSGKREARRIRRGTEDATGGPCA